MDSDAIVTAANAAESLPNTSAGKPERNSYQVRKAIEGLIHLIFLLCGIVAVAFVLLISIYLIVSGLPAIREIGLVKFLLGRVWDPTNTTTGAQYGILAFILSSVYGTAGAIVVGVPVGLMTAVFLAKVAPPKLAAVIRTAVQLLAGIPSVVYGLVGMIVLVPAIRNTFSLSSGACLLAAIIVLAIMILPTILRTTQESLKTVPQSYREGALGLGAGKWRMVRTVVLPNAIDGIVTGCILAVGRIVGESAALLYTAGFGLVLNSFGTALHSSSATLTVALYVYANERGETAVAFSIATILMLLTLLINLSAAFLGRKLKKN